MITFYSTQYNYNVIKTYNQHKNRDVLILKNYSISDPLCFVLHLYHILQLGLATLKCSMTAVASGH